MGSSLGTRHLAILTAALVLVCSVRAANSAVDAPDPEADVMEMSIEELFDLDVTTASKKKETLSTAPALSHIITREQILRYGYRTVGEALSSVLGFYPTTDLAYDYTGVRGFGRSGDSNTRILVLFDGQRVNDPLYGFGAVDESLSIDIDGVERIEVVKGPGSALWGSNALLAVVNIVPQTGGDIDGAELGMEYGTHDRIRGYAKAGKKFDNGLEIAALFSAFDANGDSDIDIPGIGAGGAAADAGDHDHESAERGYLTASYQGFTFNLFAGSRNRDDPTGANYTIFNSPFEGTSYEDDRFYTQLSYERELLPDWDAKLFARIYHSVYNHYAENTIHGLFFRPSIPTSTPIPVKRSGGAASCGLRSNPTTASSWSAGSSITISTKPNSRTSIDFRFTSTKTWIGGSWPVTCRGSSRFSSSYGWFWEVAWTTTQTSQPNGVQG